MKLSERNWRAQWALVAGLACAVAGCHNASRSTNTPAAQVVATPPLLSKATTTASPPDDLGRAIKLKTPARRVVVIGPGATETLFAIGAGNVLVGRDQASTYPVRATKAPIAGDYQGPNVEQVIALHPDLVVVQGESYGATRADDWQAKTGVPVAILAATTVEQVAKGVVKLGTWTDHQVAAQRVADSFQFPPLLSARNSSDNTSQTAFFEVSRLPLSTAGSGTLIDDVLRRAEYTNVAQGIKGYKDYSRESLLAHPPRAYVVTYEGEANDPLKAASALAELQRDPTVGKLPCVRRNDVVFIPANWLLRPGPRLVAGLMMLRAFHAQRLPKTK